jgi:hypothetical protein
MATDSIVAGLFATPEQYQQQRQAQQQAQAIQMAQLSPFEQGLVNQRMGINRIADVGAGLLGIQDPQMQLQVNRRAMLQQVDASNPASLKQAIQASSNDPELQQFFFNKYRELTNIQKEESVIKKNENWQAAQADAEKKRNVVAEVEDKLSRGEQVDNVTLNKAKLAFGDISRPKTFQQADGTIVTLPPTVDTNMFPNIGKYMSGGAGTGGGAKVAGVIETPASIAAKEAGISTAQGAIAGIDDSLNAVKGIRDLRAGSISTNPFLVDMMKNVPSAAMAQEDLIKTITAGKVIDTISEMKAQSKTGATGFGALNGRELDQLESKARRLNPQSPTFEADLKYIEDKLVDSRKKIEGALSKKQAAMPASPANNPAGTEGRVAILQQEYAKAAQAGNQADMAGLTRELATLGAKPLTAGAQKSTLTFEQKVQRTMAANPGASRASVEAQLRAAGHK